MDKIKMYFDSFYDKICNHIDNDEMFVIVGLGEDICIFEDFIDDEYNIEQYVEYGESPITYEDNEDYLLSYSPVYGKYDATLYIEEAKAINGEYKLSDLDNCTYYVLCDIPERVAMNKFRGGMIKYIELINEDEDVLFEGELEESDCEGCPEYCNCHPQFSDSQEEEARLLYEYAKLILGETCDEYKLAVLCELAFMFKQIGFTDCKDTIQGFVDKLD